MKEPDGVEFDIEDPDVESLTIYVKPDTLDYHMVIHKMTRSNIYDVLKDLVERMENEGLEVKQEDILN